MKILITLIFFESLFIPNVKEGAHYLKFFLGGAVDAYGSRRGVFEHHFKLVFHTTRSHVLPIKTVGVISP